MRRTISPAALLAALAGLALCLTDLAAQGDDKDWGTVKGRVVFGGPTVPTPAPLKVDKDMAHCLAKGPILDEEWVVNKDNKGVRWVFVWLASEDGKTPPPVHPQLKALKEKEVVMDQPQCRFEPHALAMREGQVLVAKNSAPIAHNYHWIGYPLKNPGGNVIIPPAGQHPISDLRADRFPVSIKCDIHPWMKAYVRVYDHPYYAVTDADGKFEIKLAPAGNYRLVVWHDTGWGPAGRDGAKITIKGGGTTEVEPIALKPAEGK